MQFNSYIFILCFLPVTVIGYYLSNKVNIVVGKIFLVVASIFFYAYLGWKITLILLLSVLINYFFAKVLSLYNKHRKMLLIVSVLFNIMLLFYYKYYNFFIENVNLIFRKDYSVKDVILPIGISFFTFQQIAYLVNVYRNEIAGICLIDYASYVLFFPKLLMGPIMEPTDFILQINNKKLKKINWYNVSCGIKIFSFGLFKKVLLADTFSKAVTWGFNHFDTATSMDWLLVMLFYTFEIYFDFSGYSDMAVGSSLMLNITLPINFDSPYKALSIRDFWKRWHISLTGFLTKYIYIPLGGNKKGTIRTYINTMIVFLISGIWHGGGQTFILWGALHGIFSVLERMFDSGKRKFLDIVRWGITFGVINIMWLLFRAESITQWRNILAKIVCFQNTTASSDLLNVFNVSEAGFFQDILHIEGLEANIRGFWLLIFMIGTYWVCLVPENNYKKLQNNNYGNMILAAIAFIWSFLCLSSESVFVYFNF